MNPWAELGIEPTNDVSVIRRAYAARAKRTRPDEDPAGFARLRAAYEAALAIAERQVATGQASDEDEATAEPVEPEEKPQPETEKPPPEVAAVLNDIHARFGRRDTAAAAMLVADAIDSGVLPIELEMQLADQVLVATVQDRELRGPQLEEIVRRFHWDGRGLGVSGPRANYLKALQARLAAEDWLTALRKLGASWRAYFGAAKPVAARLILGRGRIRSLLVWILPLDVPLKRFVAELHFHGGWVGREFDSDRVASIEQLLQWNLRRPLEVAARIAAFVVAFVVVLALPAIFGPAAALPTLVLLGVLARYALPPLKRALGRFFRLVYVPLWTGLIIGAFALVGALNPPAPPRTPAVNAGPAEGSPAWIETMRGRAQGGELLAAYQLGMYLAKPNRTSAEQTEAIKWLTAAEPRYTAASTMLGLVYQLGRGTEPDPVEARRHYKLAADTGDPQAQVNLGLLMNEGAGGAKDPDGAFKLFLTAARRSKNALAIMEVGLCYRDGRGVTADKSKAKAWLAAAAGSGQPMAMLWLGKLYLGGGGAAPNYAEAYRWLRLGARERGTTAPDSDLDNGLSVAKQHLPTATQVAIDSALIDWKPADPVLPPA